MARRDDTDPEDVDTMETLPDEDDPGNTGLRDPGIDRHDFAGEWESLWQEVEGDPRESLPGLEDIVRRLLERHGYVLTGADPVGSGDEVEILTTYASVRDVADAVRAGADVGPGDVGQAIADVRELYTSLVDRVEGDAR